MDIQKLYVKIPINHTHNIVNKLLKNNRIDGCTTYYNGTYIHT
jgi:hypothetical protein